MKAPRPVTSGGSAEPWFEGAQEGQEGRGGQELRRGLLGARAPPVQAEVGHVFLGQTGQTPSSPLLPLPCSSPGPVHSRPWPLDTAPGLLGSPPPLPTDPLLR